MTSTRVSDNYTKIRHVLVLASDDSERIFVYQACFERNGNSKVKELKGRYYCVSIRCGLVTLHGIVDRVDIGSGNDLLPDGNGSSAEKKRIHCQLDCLE